MISLDIRGMPEIQAMLRNLAEDQMPYAISTALNNTAFKTLQAQKKEIASVFDRPTPFVQKSMWIEKATKENLTATVEANRQTNKVNGDTVWNRILTPHVMGAGTGSRRWRAAEHRLNKAGILPQGWFAVPGKDEELDQYGNLPGGRWMQILSWLNAATPGSQGALQNRNEKTSKRKNKLERAGQSMFAVIPGRPGRNRGLKPGVWLYTKDSSGSVFNTIRPVLIFVNRATYRPRLDWYGVGKKVAEKELPIEMAKAIRRAIQTAR